MSFCLVVTLSSAMRASYFFLRVQLSFHIFCDYSWHHFDNFITLAVILVGFSSCEILFGSQTVNPIQVG